ncbi:MAG: DUF2079 domain-containing protein [Microcoleus sp. PH2017_10_PVI_O_A]|nr:DUF2079 domain-containing protein [Microcoleus sp. PH2017_10_PVI_O_A]MCC3458998.1 DUF2079 domain-containing protein [Microcoleus sp. PH2017_11_PCY_U_A]MCC3477830.1 DUF2079 domain-containing protein [Microcoleus sp. PH2017_12_PCY_D_A]MCC3527773.1 DUF2079 domain-containing protein [Microcoleus sp. PH2017_21_RUC_O_A]MCC3539834.1 DUF2079 domain-containing protein [Microcoleus sp. PH2017_22_RUC_O_B]MCC3558799.1 DUF2079 domain-containing protein [Microcoleus sp. PH2017_27_LUM_O_A]TAE84721.1 MAG:
MIVITTIILFAASSARHALFHSTAYDLAIFDQAIYLISQNQTPFSSLMEINILGDHAAFIFYPLALLYKIYPDVHWLLFVQAFALALGAWPSWSLARQAGLDEPRAIAISAMYLLYPVVFNVNLFDFHPEVIAMPAILAAILAARLDKTLWFCAAILLILSCKAVLSLTVLMMGVWLFFFEKTRKCGLIAIFLGAAWFLIATQAIVPYFNQGKQHAGIGRYQYLGNSVLEIAINLILKPNLILGRLFSADTFGYLILLFFPVIWWLSPRHLSPLIGAFPMLVMNILSDIDAQRDLIHQYSVPIFPFVLTVVISTIADRQRRGNNFWKNAWNYLWNHRNLMPRIWKPVSKRISVKTVKHIWMHRLSIRRSWRWGKLLFANVSKLLILWSLLSFLILAKYGYFGTIYLESLDTWQATRQAINRVQTQGNVLTDNSLATHLAHRTTIKLLHQVAKGQNLNKFEYVLLNMRHPWHDTAATAARVVTQLKKSPEFKISYQQDDVWLFQKVRN